MKRGNSIEQHRRSVVLSVDRIRETQRECQAKLRESQDTKPGTNTLCLFYCLMVLAISILIGFSIWLSIQMSRKHEMALLERDRYAGRELFTFEDIFNSSCRPKYFKAKWLPDRDTFVYRDNDGHLKAFDAAEDKTTIIVDKSVFESLKTNSYYPSSDLHYILFPYDIKKVWRHSFLAKYKIYDLTVDVSDDRLIDFPNSKKLKNAELQFAGWSPTNYALSFVYKNDLFYQPSPSSKPKRITNTGDKTYIFNGIPDWLYEEEILQSHVGHWWSPDARYICYAVFNDTNVPLYQYPYYGSSSDLYEKTLQFAYPKAGDRTPGANTKASLYVVDTQRLSKPHRRLRPPQELKHQDHYFIQLLWQGPKQVTIVWANRVQNVSITTICSMGNSSCYMMHKQTVFAGWIDPTPQLWFLHNNVDYVTILPKEDGVSGAWNNIALISSKAKKEGDITFLTEGQQEVKEIVGYHPGKQTIYFLSTNGDSKQRHLLSTRLPTENGTHDRGSRQKCLSCDLDKDCQFVSATFSSSGIYYIIGCLGPGIPFYRLRCTEDESRDFLLEDNAELNRTLHDKYMPFIEYKKIKLPGGHDVMAKILIPLKLKLPDGKDFRPLIIEANSEVGGQAVDERYSLGWQTYMVSSHNVIYAYIDGRGTASRGQRFKHSLYRKLGTLDVEDQLLATKYLKKNLGFVDKKNLIIWGWAYGGLIAAHAIANQSNHIPCAIAGAALSDIRYHNTASAERHMGLARLEDNSAGYDRANVLSKAELFKNKTFLLIHGTADDNVHFSSSAQLMKTLIETEVQFRIQIYPDLSHYFRSHNRHFYRLLTEFANEGCFNRPMPKEPFQINMDIPPLAIEVSS